MSFTKSMKSLLSAAAFFTACGALVLAGHPSLADSGGIVSSETKPATVRPMGINVTELGAVGDGKTDDTAAIQRAIDKAAQTQDTVMFPTGVYSCSALHVPAHVGLSGLATWAYRKGGGSVLRLNDPNAKCLLDISKGVGVTINGLTLEGANLGTEVHGISMMQKNSEKKNEDAFRIERCYISNFTGDGIHLQEVWCFSIRECEVGHNRGNGLYIEGYDGFIIDNWFSGNGKSGIRGGLSSSSTTITGNRVEWNHENGIRITGGGFYNITGNYLDRSGGPAIYLSQDGGDMNSIFTITGNVIFRSGRPEWTTDPLDSAHVRFINVRGLTFIGNSMCVGQDDGVSGKMSPMYGIVIEKLKNSVIANNTLHIGATKELIHDMGQHGEGVIIKDNPGTVFIDKGVSIWGSGQF